MRGIGRIFGVVPKTLLRWLKAALLKLPKLKETLASAQDDDILELDELWSFVLKKRAWFILLDISFTVLIYKNTHLRCSGPYQGICIRQCRTQTVKMILPILNHAKNKLC